MEPFFRIVADPQAARQVEEKPATPSEDELEAMGWRIRRELD